MPYIDRKHHHADGALTHSDFIVEGKTVAVFTYDKGRTSGSLQVGSAGEKTKFDSVADAINHMKERVSSAA